MTPKQANVVEMIRKLRELGAVKVTVRRDLVESVEFKQPTIVLHANEDPRKDKDEKEPSMLDWSSAP